MLKQGAFIVLVFVVALVGTIAHYWLVTELHLWMDLLACFVELILGGICIAPIPEVL